MAPDIVGHLVGGEAINAVMSPSGLIWRVVWHLVLEENRSSVFAVPDHLVALVMFNKQSVGGDVIPVHDQAVRGGVARPPYAGAVIGPPGPDVINDHVVGVDFEAAAWCRSVGRPHSRASDGTGPPGKPPSAPI